MAQEKRFTEFLWIWQRFIMIELKGIYHNSINKNPLSVLVQYDGQLLHVWHLTDPFYRLRSGSRFSIKPKNKKSEKVIKFPDGASIETENTDALESLQIMICHSHGLKLNAYFQKWKSLGMGVAFILLFWVGWLILK